MPGFHPQHAAHASIPRLPSGTAGRIVVHLRQADRTVDDLAAELSLTANAVRLHLARLEREGLIRRAGFRPGVSRPAVLYALTPEAELLFSRAYIPVLTQLLHVLSAKLGPREFDALMRQVGGQLMAGRPRPTGSLRERAKRGSALLNELGGVSRVATEEKRLVIRGDSCPLAAATRDHPEACNAVEGLLSEFVGAQVTSCCERQSRLRCCFAIGAPA
jgi:predicted ArsR family transcriptional regulator